MLAELQSAMAAHLLTGESEVANRLRRDLPPGRLQVYRNTVIGSLAEVLGNAHPSVRHRLGSDRFTPLACGFAAAVPPRRPMLWCYGAGFADWLAERTGTDLTSGDGAPWLADLARLDWAMHEALFAEDADAVDPSRLATLPPDQVGGLRLVPHPAVRLVRSPWPVHRLWKEPDSPPPDEPEPEAVLIGRPGAEVLCARLDPGEGRCAQALLAAARLDEVAEAEGGDRLQAVLGLLLGNRLVTGFALGPGRHDSEGGET